MVKMYTREEVIRLLAGERGRSLALINEKIDELEKQGRRQPALKTSIIRAVERLGEVMRDVMGVKLSKNDDYHQSLMSICEKQWLGPTPVVDMKTLDAVVFPSDEKTILVVNDEEYGGAHCYLLRECLGFHDGGTVYTDTEQVIQFIQKQDDGSVIPGLQSEQLVLALIDRHKKLNARFPSAQNEKMIQGLEMFLEASRERVEERMSRGVMGELKK